MLLVRTRTGSLILRCEQNVVQQLCCCVVLKNKNTRANIQCRDVLKRTSSEYFRVELHSVCSKVLFDFSWKVASRPYLILTPKQCDLFYNNFACI